MIDKITIFLYNLFRFITLKLPRKIAYLPGKFIGYLAYLLTPKRRKLAQKNIKKALGVSDAEAKKITKKVYLNLGLNFAEFLMEDQFTEADIEEMVEFNNLEYLDQALEENKGVIIYSAHLGNWELLGALLAIKGYKINSIAKEQKNSLFDQKINEIRRGIGIGIIPKGLAVRKAFKALRKNEIVALLGDQDARSKGWKMNFFGRPASVFLGAVQFAQRTGAPIVPIFFHRQGWLEHELICYPPIKIAADSSEAELKVELKRLLDLTEKEIERSPEDWMWLHRRWKKYN
ncbi:lysophospholipid acyltransferase family protein [Halanaerobium hydrogeniformans]|uniref:Lipid A biosynthesis acyltransferase n=1 Tax=Halanaerobium hydrogeniformans TaxID=656519 RepID=E4RJX7_HALHG|nr:lysophospholipid acyltransferase family protein [Halanaerobium hydrogeniformans]ADQ15547.1 lipid A biosynthesis acyltransferase [Halanaerobium hydrogeniformans]